ncbi:MAG TPA: glycoside hydrolase family 3 N-terminal domain-containing protein [Egicoccus sp.]|nr:glycoside hydrolase family 3 N-terminal domain-containing protein [Egicoccus sp.]HSK24118.1 glycoside hydrolase family 3 N-terminal domain-containing protein [Egicoccus sp.]
MTTPTAPRASAALPYRDPDLPTAERVADLLGRMTAEEKRAQLGSAWVFQLLDSRSLSTEAAERLLADGIGQITRVSGASDLGATEAADLADEIQRHLLERTRLGIPAIVHEENCAGLMAREATIFPQAIGVASTWQPELAQAVADVARRQMRAAGAHQGLAPVLDVCRDPRWGRLEETFGEDPHLVASMGVAAVRGLQAELGPAGVVATGKHFVGYGISEGGMNWAPAHIPARELREVYLHPFEAAVRDAGLRSIMNGYHELDGIPCGASRELLTTILREEWGFDGIVVSDYFSINQLWEYHQVASSKAAAAAMALRAGLDVELPSTDCYDAPLAEALATGLVEQSVLDEAVRRVLAVKFDLGLFEQPYVDRAAAEPFDTPEQRRLARDVARRSLVLLKNEPGLLPLAPTMRRIAVIGPNTDSGRNLIGDYSYPSHIDSLLEMQAENTFGVPMPDDLDLAPTSVPITSVVDALREHLPGAEITHAVGCEINSDATDGFDAAVAAARDADVAVVVVGDRAGLTWDATSGESRDRTSLDLPGVQEDLVRAVVATGTPVVAVLVVGRPGGSTWLHEHCQAVLLAWLPGEEGGHAVAEAIAGTVNPGGKLPVSWPRSVGQIPVYHGHKTSGGRSHWKGDYVDEASSPRYPFGFGLSYTSFEITGATLSATEVACGETVLLEVGLRNTGALAGDEVVQVYTRSRGTSVTRPVRELRGFARVGLDPGASTTLRFHLDTDQFGFYDRDMHYVVEPGEVEVLVGRSAADPEVTTGFTLVGDKPHRPEGRGFTSRVEVG